MSRPTIIDFIFINVCFYTAFKMFIPCKNKYISNIIISNLIITSSLNKFFICFFSILLLSFFTYSKFLLKLSEYINILFSILVLPSFIFLQINSFFLSIFNDKLFLVLKHIQMNTQYLLKLFTIFHSLSDSQLKFFLCSQHVQKNNNSIKLQKQIRFFIQYTYLILFFYQLYYITIYLWFTTNQIKVYNWTLSKRKRAFNP